MLRDQADKSNATSVSIKTLFFLPKNMQSKKARDGRGVPPRRSHFEAVGEGRKVMKSPPDVPKAPVCACSVTSRARLERGLRCTLLFTRAASHRCGTRAGTCPLNAPEACECVYKCANSMYVCSHEAVKWLGPSAILCMWTPPSIGPS